MRTVVAKLKDKGAVIRGWLGVQIRPVTAEVAQEFGVGDARGALIVEPQPNSPAARAGLVSGDVVASLNREPLKDDRDLMKRIGDLAPGTSLELGVLRKGEKMTVKLTLGEPPRSAE